MVEGHGIEALGVVLVMGARVLGEGIDEGSTEEGVQRGKEIVGIVDRQRSGRGGGSKAATGIGVTVGIRKIGLDIENGCAVNEVGTRHNEDMSLIGSHLDTQKAHAGEPYGVGTKGAAGGEDPYPFVATKTRGADCGRPVLAFGKVELPKKPEVVKLVNTTEGFGNTVVRLEYHTAFIVDEASLPRHAEFLFERGFYVGDGLHRPNYLGVQK